MTYIYSLKAFNQSKKLKLSRDGPRWPKGFRVAYDPGLFCRFGSTRVVRFQANAPAAFTRGEIPGTHFHRLIRPQGTWFCRGTTEKVPSDITGNRSPDRPFQPEYLSVNAETNKIPNN